MSKKPSKPPPDSGEAIARSAWGRTGTALRHAAQTPERRSAIARHAAEVRWAREKGGKP
jgi:hypothetical protein